MRYLNVSLAQKQCENAKDAFCNIIRTSFVTSALSEKNNLRYAFVSNAKMINVRLVQIKSDVRMCVMYKSRLFKSVYLNIFFFFSNNVNCSCILFQTNCGI